MNEEESVWSELTMPPNDGIWDASRFIKEYMTDFSPAKKDLDEKFIYAPRKHGKSHISTMTSGGGGTTGTTSRAGMSVSKENIMEMFDKFLADKKKESKSYSHELDILDGKLDKESELIGELPFALEKACRKEFLNQLLDAIAKERVKVVLSAPMNLTVAKADGSKTKKAHIGGEEFLLSHIHIYPKDQITFLLTPLDKTLYRHVEIRADVALKSFSGLERDILRVISTHVKFPDDGVDTKLIEDNPDFGSW